MSVEASTWVWEYSKSRLAARLVMLRIANNADEHGGNSWHTIPRIARATRLSERNVTRALRSLEKIGELATNFRAGPYEANIYTILPMCGDKLSPRVVTNRTLCGDKSDSVIRKERPITSRAKTPPTPPFQGGVSRRDRRMIGKHESAWWDNTLDREGQRKELYRTMSAEELSAACDLYIAGRLMMPVDIINAVRREALNVSTTSGKGKSNGKTEHDS